MSKKQSVYDRGAHGKLKNTRHSAMLGGNLIGMKGVAGKMKKIREILAQLGQELQRAEDIDVETRATLKDLHSDVDRMAGSGEFEIEPVLDTVKALEARFAVSHPNLEQMARELADAISKMGI
jgi:type II secretory pathway component GspD/PulD (secretin)